MNDELIILLARLQISMGNTAQKALDNDDAGSYSYLNNFAGMLHDIMIENLDGPLLSKYTEQRNLLLTDDSENKLKD